MEQSMDVSVKAPEFTKTEINGSFSILEAQFHLENMTTLKTKFYTVVASQRTESVAKLLIATMES